MEWEEQRACFQTQLARLADGREVGGQEKWDGGLSIPYISSKSAGEVNYLSLRNKSAENILFKAKRYQDSKK